MRKVQIVVFLVSAALFGLILSDLFPPDTAIEEALEEVIRQDTGQDVDLSPGKGDKY